MPGKTRRRPRTVLPQPVGTPTVSGDGSGVPGTSTTTPQALPTRAAMGGSDALARLVDPGVSQARFEALVDLLDELVGTLEISQQARYRQRLATIRNIAAPG